MDWTHVLAFLAPYLPTVGTFLKEMFQRWLDARYPKPDQPPTETAAQVQPTGYRTVLLKEGEAIYNEKELNKHIDTIRSLNPAPKPAPIAEPPASS